ncbi:MAG: hypothetical protein V1824_02330, partial [archaeon]
MIDIDSKAPGATNGVCPICSQRFGGYSKNIFLCPNCRNKINLEDCLINNITEYKNNPNSLEFI